MLWQLQLTKFDCDNFLALGVVKNGHRVLVFDFRRPKFSKRKTRPILEPTLWQVHVTYFKEKELLLILQYRA